MSTFNSDQFLASRGQGALDTKYPVCPAGEYEAVIDGLSARQQEIKTGDRAGSIATILDVSWSVNDDRLRELLGRDKVLVRQSIFLDLTREGQLDYGTGKNVKLGRLRDVLGQNDPSREWWINMLQGGSAKITVKHSANPNDASTPYANVDDVAALR